VVTWTHHENWWDVEKFTDSKTAILFYLRRKTTKLSRKNRFRTVVCHQALVDASRLELTLVVNTMLLADRWINTQLWSSNYLLQSSRKLEKTKKTRNNYVHTRFEKVRMLILFQSESLSEDHSLCLLISSILARVVDRTALQQHK